MRTLTITAAEWASGAGTIVGTLVAEAVLATVVWLVLVWVGAK